MSVPSSWAEAHRIRFVGGRGVGITDPADSVDEHQHRDDQEERIA